MSPTVCVMQVLVFLMVPVMIQAVLEEHLGIHLPQLVYPVMFLMLPVLTFVSSRYYFNGRHGLFSGTAHYLSRQYDPGWDIQAARAAYGKFLVGPFLLFGAYWLILLAGIVRGRQATSETWDAFVATMS